MANKLTHTTISSPNNINETCAMLTIDTTSNPFVFHNILLPTETDYVFTTYVKSSVAGSITVGGKTVNTTTSWSKKVITFTNTDTSNKNLQMSFGTNGTYYLYQTKLETGNLSTHYSSAPEDGSDTLQHIQTVSEQTAEGFKWLVNGTQDTGFYISDGGIEAITEKFSIKGSDGSMTVINGGRIETGSIIGNDIKANSITAREITAENISGSNGWINLSQGTFDYGNGKLSWNGTSLSIDGNGTFTGTINATSGSFSGTVNASAGSFGGWTITSNGLARASTTTIQNSGYSNNMDGFWSNWFSWSKVDSNSGTTGSNINNGDMYFGNDGLAVSSNFTVSPSGYMKTKSGQIGGFTITASSIYNGANSLSSTSDGVYIGTDGINFGGGKFKVTNSGVLTSTSGTIGGWNITDSNMYYGNVTSIGDSSKTDSRIGFCLDPSSGFRLNASDVSQLVCINSNFWKYDECTSIYIHNGTTTSTKYYSRGAFHNLGFECRYYSDKDRTTLTSSAKLYGDQINVTNPNGNKVDIMKDGYVLSTTSYGTARLGASGSSIPYQLDLKQKNTSDWCIRLERDANGTSMGLGYLNGHRAYFQSNPDAGSNFVDSYVLVSDGTHKIDLRCASSGVHGLYNAQSGVNRWLLYETADNKTAVLQASTDVRMLNINAGKYVSLFYDTPSCFFLPSSDNSVYLGRTTMRWNTVYAATGTVQTSDRKLKNVIEDFDWKSDEFFEKIEPVAYTMKDVGSTGTRTHLGVIAQDVSSLCNDIDMGDMAMYQASYKDGQPYYGEETDDEKLVWSFNYSELIAPMIVQIKKLMARVGTLEAELKELKGE